MNLLRLYSRNEQIFAPIISPQIALFHWSFPWKLGQNEESHNSPAQEPINEGEIFAFNHVVKKKHKLKPAHNISTQIKYMQSRAFEEAYQGMPIWKWYKRNIKGQAKFQGPPRLFCITKEGKFKTGNPCPVCRDEYLYFDYKNPALLLHFLQDGTTTPIELLKSGLCRDQYTLLRAEILKAQEHGTLTFMVPFKHYDYDDFYPNGSSIFESPSDVDDHDQDQDRPMIIFPVHRPDTDTDWDEWWTRWDRFARKAR